MGYPHAIKGNAIYAYVMSSRARKKQPIKTREINNLLSKELGPIAKADKIQFVRGLPKTRSGKL